MREGFWSTGLNLSDPCVLYKSLCHPIDATTMRHLELFHDPSHEPSRGPSHDPSRSSAERTTPPRSAHVQLDDDLRLLDPARGDGEVEEFPINTILAWIINNYYEQGNIIITNLLLPLWNISNTCFV